MSDRPWAGILQAARETWGDGLPATPDNLRAAAVGLASDWYRNTDAVESHAHADGPWTDADMLRRNAWATGLSRDALTSLADGAIADAHPILEELLAALIDMLPNARARRSLRSEKANAPFLAADWVATNGLGNWLAYLNNAFLYPNDWWGAPGFASFVEQYCGLDPGPPEPATFRDRLLNTPWELSDEQAWFVVSRQYDLNY